MKRFICNLRYIFVFIFDNIINDYEKFESFILRYALCNKPLCASIALDDYQRKLFLSQIGERYHFTIFHVEREGCGSNLMIDASGFYFILDSLEEPPRDYIVYISEDFYPGGIIETIFLADSFSAGPPFNVNILRGTLYLFYIYLCNSTMIWIFEPTVHFLYSAAHMILHSYIL